MQWFYVTSLKLRSSYFRVRPMLVRGVHESRLVVGADTESEKRLSDSEICELEIVVFLEDSIQRRLGATLSEIMRSLHKMLNDRKPVIFMFHMFDF